MLMLMVVSGLCLQSSITVHRTCSSDASVEQMADDHPEDEQTRPGISHQLYSARSTDACFTNAL